MILMLRWPLSIPALVGAKGNVLLVGRQEGAVKKCFERTWAGRLPSLDLAVT